jgi:hypothetical protein
MRDAGILDGDLLAVRQSPEARNGQIVVARIEDEVTVKYFQRNGDRVYACCPPTPITPRSRSTRAAGNWSSRESGSAWYGRWKSDETGCHADLLIAGGKTLLPPPPLLRLVHANAWMRFCGKPGA